MCAFTCALRTVRTYIAPQRTQEHSAARTVLLGVIVPLQILQGREFKYPRQPGMAKATDNLCGQEHRAFIPDAKCETQRAKWKAKVVNALFSAPRWLLPNNLPMLAAEMFNDVFRLMIPTTQTVFHALTLLHPE